MAADVGTAATYVSNPNQQGGEDLMRMLRTRWDDGAFSDIRVRVFNNEYPLHRMVLCRSPFFDSLLQGEWREKDEQVCGVAEDFDCCKLSAFLVVDDA